MNRILAVTGNLAFNLALALFVTALLLGALVFCFMAITLTAAFAVLAAPVLLIGWAICDAFGVVW